MHKELVNFSCTCNIADALVGVSACTLQIAIWCIIFLMYRSVFRLLCVVVQGQATDMDWTLHTDLSKSETSRDIKKKI